MGLGRAFFPIRDCMAKPAALRLAFILNAVEEYLQ
jgi:hypothetical protein